MPSAPSPASPGRGAAHPCGIRARLPLPRPPGWGPRRRSLCSRPGHRSPQGRAPPSPVTALGSRRGVGPVPFPQFPAGARGAAGTRQHRGRLRSPGSVGSGRDSGIPAPHLPRLVARLSPPHSSRGPRHGRPASGSRPRWLSAGCRPRRSPPPTPRTSLLRTIPRARRRPMPLRAPSSSATPARLMSSLAPAGPGPDIAVPGAAAAQAPQHRAGAAPAPTVAQA